MGEIGPRFKRAELEKSGMATVRGDGISEGLRGVTADAMKMDPAAHQTNRELAKKIQQLVADLKPSDGGVPRFVLAWRMYPNAESEHWDKAAAGHVCGCGCGCPIGA